MMTTGVLGQPWRASVTPWGAVEPWPDQADARTLDWFVAADDRWHVPADEATVRQDRVDGTPVEKADVSLERGGAAGGGPRRAMMFAVATLDDSGGEESTMTFGQQNVKTDADGVAVIVDNITPVVVEFLADSGLIPRPGG